MTTETSPDKEVRLGLTFFDAIKSLKGGGFARLPEWDASLKVVRVRTEVAIESDILGFLAIDEDNCIVLTANDIVSDWEDIVEDIVRTDWNSIA